VFDSKVVHYLKRKNMMKFTMMFVVLLVSTTSLMSMENKSPEECLNFMLNASHCIKGYSAQSMTYYEKPEEFLGKKILDVVPLDINDRDSLDDGFKKAGIDKITMKVPYALKNKQFLATITPMLNAKNKCIFFVKITKENNNQ
jgi:hypothetical protein